MTATAVESRTRPLTNLDRCDRCPAAATMVARSAVNRELFFCDHHTNEYREALEYSGFYMDCETLDERI